MLHERESPALASARPAPKHPSGERSIRYARWSTVVAVLVGSALALLWLGLTTWRLERVPGMSLDEAWSILSARGLWAPHDPLSGMTSYAGPFPVLLLRWLGTEHGVLLLRGTSVVANGACLVVLGLLLGRAFPRGGHVLWMLPMIATSPVWLVVMRTGIEVVMFTPLLVVLGLYAFTLGTRRALFAGGFIWGLSIYNHLIGGCIALGVVLAWRVARLRWPLREPKLMLAVLLGGLLGLLPRLVALVIYNDHPLEGTPQGYSVRAALGDLRWVPICLWRTLQGDTAYLRYVGRLALPPWPYWGLGVVFIAPWVHRLRRVPPVAWFALLSALLSALLMTLAAPYIAVRFFILPVAGVTAFLALLGAAAIEGDVRWRAPIMGTAVALSALNVFFTISNFHRPWRDDRLAVTTFWLGDRSKRTGNWAYLPKEALVEQLRRLDPPPEQVITIPTLERPLRVLLDGSPIRVVLPPVADHARRSVFVDYRVPDALGPHCVEVPDGRFCFGAPSPIAEYFLLYR
jgi:hypothetical protein